MDQRKTVKEDFESTPVGRRRMGRPNLRWFEDVGKISAGDEDGDRRQRMGKFGLL
jgi:hypothetical protein